MKPFDDLSILLLEDEYLIALDAEQILTGLGVRKVEIVNTLESAAQAAAQGNADVAVLDLNINGEMSFGVAAELRRKGTPVVFASGYEMRDQQAPEIADAVYLNKPYTRDALRAAIAAALDKKPSAAAA